MEVVRRRGYVMVGTYDDVPGFSEEVLGPQGGPSVWQGFDVDLGRAVAAAVLGDPTAVQFFRVTTVDRFPKLRVRGVDMVAAAASWTSGRDASREEGLRFLGPSWYDVQAYVTATATGITSIQGFAGKVSRPASFEPVSHAASSNVPTHKRSLAPALDHLRQLSAPWQSLLIVLHRRCLLAGCIYA